MEKKRKSGTAYLMQLAGKYKLHLFVSALFGIASALCSFVPYVMVYRSILVLLDGEGNALRYGLIAAAAIAGKFLCSIVSGTFSHIGAFNTLYNVRTQISRHIAKVNLGFFTDHASGEIKKVIIEDVERIERFLAHQIPDVTSAICAPVIVFIYLLTINVPMALCLLVPVVLGLIIQGVAMAITGKQMPTYHRLLEKLNTAIMQFINGMPVMKAYNMTAESYRDYADTVEEYNAFWKRCTKSQGYTYGLFVALVESGILFALPLGGLLYFRGALPMQDYLYFMVMSMVFLSGLLNLMNFAMMFSQIMSGVGRIQTIMDLPCTTEGIQTLDRAQPYGVSFEDVTFRYDKSDVLKNITLSLPAGSLTAFVGASGAGKTTAAQLIPKFWEVAEGSICIGGKNILELKNDNLMDLVSFVFQETFTLHDSIYENIAIGNKEATPQQVEAAAKAAQIHDFIMSLPNGYKTKLGEDGVKLSGGEKQLLAFASVYAMGPKLYILDEPTTGLHFADVHKLVEILKRLSEGGNTVVVIEHNLDVIKTADYIIDIGPEGGDKGGTVVAQGTPEEVAQSPVSYTGKYVKKYLK